MSKEAWKPKQDDDPLTKAVNNALGHLASGKIAFESPLRMNLNESKRVEVRIARDWSQALTEGLATNGQVTVEDIQVGTLMAASLKGSAFKITPITPEEQVLTSDNYTAWDWEVHPLDWGKQTLYLNVCVRLRLKNSGKDERRCSVVYEREIAVTVDPVYAATHFVKNNAAYSLGVIFTGAGSLFAVVFTYVKKQRNRKRSAGFHP